MSEDLATLGIAVDARPVDSASSSLDGLVTSGAKAENQVDKLIAKSKALSGAANALGTSVDEVDRRVESLKNSIDPLYAAQNKLNKELEEAKALYKAGAINADEYGKASDVLNSRLNKVELVHARVAKGMKVTSNEMLNLTRQGSDLAVSLAMGMNPLMVLIQQGPQIADVFQTAATRGVGFKAVLREIATAGWAAVAPFAPFIAAALAVAAVLGGAFAMATHEANKQAGDFKDKLNLTHKELDKLKEKGISTKITFGDTFSAVFSVAGQRLAKAFEGPIKTVQGWFSALYNGIVRGAEWMAQAFTAVVIGIGRIGKELFAGLAAAFKGDFKTASEHLGKSTAEVLAGTWAKAGKINKDFFDDVVTKASKTRQDAIEKALDRKDKKPKKAAKTEEEKEYDRVTNAAEEYSRSLIKETAEIGLNTYERKQADTALQVEALRKVDLTVKTKKQHDEVANLIEVINKETEAYIKKAKAQQLLDLNRPVDDQLAKLKLQAELTNSSAKEQAVAMAELAAQQTLANAHIDKGTEGYQAYVDKIKLAAAAQADLDAGVGNTLVKLQKTADLSGAFADRLTTAAQAFGDAFGTVGKTMGDLVSQMAQLTASQDAYNAKLEETRVKYGDNSDEYKSILADQQANERNAYGNMLKTAKGFFKEKSAGYKVLEAAEKAWRIFEFAMEAKSVIVKLATVAAKLPAYAAEAGAAATAGAAAMFAALGPFGFAAVAAMGVVLAAWGFGGLGGGGGSTKPPQSAADAQAAQGAGSVLGDSTAQSASIANAFKIAEKYQDKDLEYGNSMVVYLKSIDTQMTSLAAAVARQISVNGGMFDTSAAGLGTNGKTGLFGGTKTTKSLYDLGVNFNSQSLSDLLSNGVNGSTYQTIQTEKTKGGFLGIGGGTKTTYDTSSGQIAGEVKDAIQSVVGQLRQGVIAAAKALGITGAEQTLDAMTIALGKLSFEGMSGSEIQDALNAVFGKLGDQMAEAVGGGLVAKFQQVGEGAFETLVRMATGVKLFDQTFDKLGKTLALTGSAAVDAKQSLIDLMGGLDTFKELTNSYVDNFLTDAEKLAPVQAAVNKEMTRLGLSAVTTKDQFKSLISGIDVSTEKGRELYASLMAVAPAFAKVADAADATSKAASVAAQKLVDDTKKAMEDSRTSLISTYQAEANGIKGVIDKFKAFSKTLKDFKQSLLTGPAAFLSPEANYKAQRDLFSTTLAKAKGGDQDAIGKLTTTAQDFLTASRDYFASSSGYTSDLDYVQQAIDGVAAFTDAAADDAQKQLDALNNLMDGLDGVIDGIVHLGDVTLSLKDGIYTVDTSVKSVAQAIIDFNASMGAYTAAVAGQIAQANAAAAAAQAAALAAQQQIADAINASRPGPSNPTPTGGDPVTPTVGTYSDRYTEIAAERPDVINEATRLLAVADRNSPWFGQHGLDGGVNGFVDWWLNNKPADDTYSPNGQQGFATGGLMTRPMTLGESGIGGEAGPEGILPLSRVGGKLGVHAKSDDETKAILAEVRDLLKKGNLIAADAALKTLEKLDSQTGALETLERKVDRQ